MELVKLLPMRRYRVNIFSYSGPSELLGSDRKQKITLAGTRGVRIVARSLSSNERTQ